MRSDNLKRHKKFCNVRRDGAGFTFTPASNGVVAARHRPSVIMKRPSLSSMIERAGEKEQRSLTSNINAEWDWKIDQLMSNINVE